MTATSRSADQQAVGRVSLKEGLLTRISHWVYFHLGLALCLALLCAPTVGALSVLSSSAANLPLFVLTQLPVAPALAAGLHAVRSWRSGADAAPFGLYLKGLRSNTIDVLKWWVPALAVLAVIAVNVGYDGGTPGGAGVQMVNLLLAAVLLLLCGHALVLSSALSFRTVDTIRLSLYLLGAGWPLTLFFVSTLIVATAIVVLASDAALLAGLWAFVSLLDLASRPTLDQITKDFTVDDA